MVAQLARVVTVAMLAQRAEEVPLHVVKVGDVILCDGWYYRVFRVVRVANAGGWVVFTAALDRHGGYGGVSVLLYFASRSDLVRLVCGEVAR